MGCLFYYIFYGSILLDDLSEGFKNVEIHIKEKLEVMINKDKSMNNMLNADSSQVIGQVDNMTPSPYSNQEFLQIDLLIKILRIDNDHRLSTQEILLHPLFWEANKCISFINKIRQKFDTIKVEHLNDLIKELTAEIRKKLITSDAFIKTLTAIQPNFRKLTTDFEKEISDTDMVTIKQTFEIVNTLFQKEHLSNIEEKVEFLNQHQDKHPRATIVKELKNVQTLLVALDSNELIVYDDWRTKLDVSFAKSLKAGYDTKKVSDLLKVIRDKVINSLSYPIIHSGDYISFNF